VFARQTSTSIWQACRASHAHEAFPRLTLKASQLAAADSRVCIFHVPLTAVCSGVRGSQPQGVAKLLDTHLPDKMDGLKGSGCDVQVCMCALASRPRRGNRASVGAEATQLGGIRAEDPLHSGYRSRPNWSTLLSPKKLIMSTNHRTPTDERRDPVRAYIVSINASEHESKPPVFGKVTACATASARDVTRYLTVTTAASHVIAALAIPLPQCRRYPTSRSMPGRRRRRRPSPRIPARARARCFILVNAGRAPASCTATGFGRTAMDAMSAVKICPKKDSNKPKYTLLFRL